MESASTSTALLDSHSLPHQQFSSRIAYIGNNTKRKPNSYLTKKSTRLPPIARCDSSPTPAQTNEVEVSSISNNDSFDSNEDFNNNNNRIDPNLRVKQLEKNLAFVKEHSQSLLKCLHNELEDLKRKNRDLQFELIIGATLSPQSTQSLTKEQILAMPTIKGSLPLEVCEHVSQLEKEIKRLRYALGETLKMNAVLQNELQKLRKKDLKEEKRSSINELGNTYFVSSPPIGDFSDTLNQIYKSARSKKQSACTLPRITNSGK